MRKGMLPIIMLPDGDLRIVLHLVPFWILTIWGSVHKASHCVETAIVCVHNDIVRAIDNKQAVLLVLLDLSAAFDTVDQCKLLEVLKNVVGISGTALAWFASYLQDRTQKVSINNEYSPTAKLKYGVPQGSVLVPVLLTTYLLPLGEILRELGVKFHCYADATQLYIPFYFDDNICVWHGKISGQNSLLDDIKFTET